MTDNSIKNKLYHIIFEAETPSGKLFDIVLLITIFLSVICVILESVADIKIQYGDVLQNLEWFFTILFTIEYFMRIYIVKKPIKYIFSFMGLVDLLAIIPTYLMFIADLHHLTIIRSIRLIRIFRIFHLSSYVRGGQTMLIALRRSLPKIIVFLMSIVLLVIVLGTLMYIIEGPMGEKNPGFEDIPNSMYWAIVTLTTVGYGSAVPITALGKFLASIIMILGYGIIAVPTGIVSAAIVRNKINPNTFRCDSCLSEGHNQLAKFCKDCGEELSID